MVDGPTEQYFPHSGIVHKTFNEALGGQISPVSAFINFVGKETPGGAHTDNRETIYWQCIGKSTWQIYDSYESKDPSFQIDLNPGDVIFVGESVVHRVVTEEPRAALGFQFRQNMI